MMMMRRPRRDDWSAQMRNCLAHHRWTPFEWGRSDCAFAFDVVAAITGYDAIAAYRAYHDEATCMRQLVRAGFPSISDLVAAHFPEISPCDAMRGDLGYPAEVPHRLMSPAIIDGPAAHSKGPDGFITIPRASITRAFAV
jgi:hypothetical protein